jgi:hypothetical protein
VRDILESQNTDIAEYYPVNNVPGWVEDDAEHLERMSSGNNMNGDEPTKSETRQGRRRQDCHENSRVPLTAHEYQPRTAGPL